MRLDEVPMPAAVAARPRDARGYPVPAITPWIDGEPRFAATGTARTYLCAVERRCSICGNEIPDGPVWRVVGGTEADAIDAHLAAGQAYRNQAATAEAPGHRACMLYAAIVCPYLARPTARRGEEATAPELIAARGERRGAGGAVVGFEAYEFRYSDVVLFRFAGLVEYRRYELGEEHLPSLTAAMRDLGTEPVTVPPYLLADEAAAQARFRAHVTGLLH